MVGIPHYQEEPCISSRNLVLSSPLVQEETDCHQTQNPDFLDDHNDGDDEVFYEETEQIWQKMSQNIDTTSTKNYSKGGDSCVKRLKKKKSQVLLEGYVEGIGSNDSDDELKRTKSLTDDHLDELKGCLDLGFGFSYDEIPELCNTLPALELCYSMSLKFLDGHHQKSPERGSPAVAETVTASSSPIANWKISSPGDHPEDVKARLKYWAQAVACTVRLCN